MKVVLGAWFLLPRLGGDVFSALMKLGVRYDTKTGFMFDGGTDVQSASMLIERATGEDVDISLRCFVCLNAACPSCPYLTTCDRRKVSPMCLCGEHTRGGGAYELYMNAFAFNLAE